jgi:hypothetical protein
MYSGGTTTLAAGATANLNTNVDRYLSRTFENNGTVTLSSGNIRFSNGTIFDNNATGVFTASPAQATSVSIVAQSSGVSGVFNNAGTFNKTGLGSFNISNDDRSLSFNNDGTVNLTQGYWDLEGGGYNNGTFNRSAGTTLGTVPPDLQPQPGRHVRPRRHAARQRHQPARRRPGHQRLDPPARRHRRHRRHQQPLDHQLAGLDRRQHVLRRHDHAGRPGPRRT